MNNAIGYAKHRSRLHDAVIRVYDAASNVIQTRERKGDSLRALRSLKRIADSQTKNRACCRDIDQSDESEAGRERVRSIVEETNHVRSSKSAKLAD